jgi:hypothetical protein
MACKPREETRRHRATTEHAMGNDIIEQVSISLLLVTALAVHMTPAFLAHAHQHPQKSLIMLVNLVPGLGWFAGLALFSSSSLTLRRVMQTAPAKTRRR